MYIGSIPDPWAPNYLPRYLAGGFRSIRLLSTWLCRALVSHLHLLHSTTSYLAHYLPRIPTCVAFGTAPYYSSASREKTTNRKATGRLAGARRSCAQTSNQLMIPDRAGVTIDHSKIDRWHTCLQTCAVTPPSFPTSYLCAYVTSPCHIKDAVRLGWDDEK